VPLPWDTAHFGFPVARLTAACYDLEAARAALKLARKNGVGLVYWQTEAGEAVPEALLAEFAGRRVDQKATFQADLSIPEPTRAADGVAGVCVREYPEGPASPVLRELALAAGMYSRFRTDPGVPEEKFVGLYTTWIERSARRELADVVLVAEDAGDGQLLGMVTVAAEGGTAEIGLVAVAADARGRGIGRLLLAAARRWMTGHGCSRAEVVTQLANVAACRLYERCGYQLIDVRDFHHFWPQRAAGADGD
jgi:dTDP-4-amino-4,6-dideoxy-D-galactose acyltransferase